MIPSSMYVWAPVRMNFDYTFRFWVKPSPAFGNCSCEGKEDLPLEMELQFGAAKWTQLSTWSFSWPFQSQFVILWGAEPTLAASTQNRWFSCVLANLPSTVKAVAIKQLEVNANQSYLNESIRLSAFHLLKFSADNSKVSVINADSMISPLSIAFKCSQCFRECFLTLEFRTSDPAVSNPKENLKVNHTVEQSPPTYLPPPPFNYTPVEQSPDRLTLSVDQPVVRTRQETEEMWKKNKSHLIELFSRSIEAKRELITIIYSAASHRPTELTRGLYAHQAIAISTSQETYYLGLTALKYNAKPEVLAVCNALLERF